MWAEHQRARATTSSSVSWKGDTPYLCRAPRGAPGGGRTARVKNKPKRTSGRAVVRTSTGLPTGYATFLDEVKARIRNAQVKAALAVNSELVLLYWRVGHDIVARQKKEGWGAQVIDRLSADLRAAFPEMQASRRGT